MKYKKILSFVITFSLMAINYPAVVYAEEDAIAASENLEVQKEDDNPDITTEGEPMKAEDMIEETEELEESENIDESDKFDSEDSETLDESEVPEESLDLEEPEEDSNSLTNVIISTKKNITICTEDNEIKEAETEINRCEISSEDGLSLEQITDFAFVESDNNSLIKMEENAFKELSLPEDISELKITFLVNENEDKIISVKSDY